LKRAPSSLPHYGGSAYEVAIALGEGKCVSAIIWY